jgi:hypothetical protein
MITLKPELAQGLEDPQALHNALQTAIELEHATIPPYLYALYSLKPGSNREIATLVRSVVLDEMTHMGLACNILNAIGGAPDIDRSDFIPKYPGALPGTVESQLVVPLSPFTQDVVSGVFMVIEEPENPLEFPTLELAAQLTIGQFYEAIAQQLSAAGESIFSGDPARQVTHDLGVAELVAITDLASALKAIETIVEQGEGTTQVPTDEEGELAHYYRFAEISHGRRLVPNPDAPPDAPPDQRYSYTGDPIPFDPAGVRQLVLNPTKESYDPGTQAAYANDSFNYTYTSLLKSLHATFNGQPDLLMTAVGLMESCKQQALDMGTLRVGTGKVAGPSFQYQPTNP